MYEKVKHENFNEIHENFLPQKSCGIAIATVFSRYTYSYWPNSNTIASE